MASQFLVNKAELNVKSEDILKIVCDVEATPHYLDGQRVKHYLTNIVATPVLIDSSYGGSLCNKNKYDINYNSEIITWKSHGYDKQDEKSFLEIKGSIDRRTGILNYISTRHNNGYWEKTGKCKKRKLIQKKF